MLHFIDWEPSVWLDERSLDVEANLETQLRAGLKSSAVLIIITSETVESRKWCRDEMGWFQTGADLEQVLVRRLYPIFLPFRHCERLPRWVKHLPTGELTWLDPERQELFADQDLAAHRSYWDQLYGWFERVSQGIVNAHSAYHQLEALANDDA